MEWWEVVDDTEGVELAQGDYLPGCLVPVRYDPDEVIKSKERPKVTFDEFDLIIVTQSCDLENAKVRNVALCPVVSVTKFNEQFPSFIKKDLENVKKGRLPGLYHLRPFPQGGDALGSIVDFREIYSLPFPYAQRKAASINPRLSLCPPFLEHFSQAFGLTYSRVALP